ncbi:MAG: transcription antitermination factor NusB [Tenericutes bacterium]|jgi:N utilization substance protein B|nr:transcription antitermination factor NusB [Mycoplasmatota bacterium]
MNRKLFREEIIKLIYAGILNPEHELDSYDKGLVATYQEFLEHIEEIDEIIDSNLFDWSITRLNYVDLAIIRYAVYELVYLNQPKEVVMNEALELTKKYSNLEDDQAKKFNNRLLQNIVDSLGEKDA